MKYLVYVRRNGEQGEECHSVYGDYEIVESDSILGAVFTWWDVVTDKAKEVYDFHKDKWELAKHPKTGVYYIKHKTGWMTYSIMVVHLYRKGCDERQELDKLDIHGIDNCSY